MNILTTNGFVGRFVTDWAGPDAIVRSVKIRLGVPNYPGDTMTLTGEVTALDDAERLVTVAVRGAQRPRRPRHRHRRRGAAVTLGAGRPGRHRRHRRHRVLEGLGAHRAEPGLRSRRRRDRGRRARAVGGRRHGHLHDGEQPRDRGRPQRRHRTAAPLQPHPLRRRRRVRHGAARRDGRRHRGGRRRGLLPGVQRALRTPVRRRCAGPAERGHAERAAYSWTSPYGLLTPASWVAMFARRYMHEYGATSEDFGRVAVVDRKHAATNPAAWFYEQPITLEDHQASRWIVEPLHLLDCCQETDGGQALVVTTAERARDLRQPPAIVAAAAQGAGADQWNMTSFYRDDIAQLPEMGVVAGELWASSGLGPGRHPDRGPLRPLHAVRAHAARGVRVLRAGRGEGLHRRTATSSSAASSR